MDNVTMVRVIAGVVCAILVVILVQRRRKRAN